MRSWYEAQTPSLTIGGHQRYRTPALRRPSGPAQRAHVDGTLVPLATLRLAEGAKADALGQRQSLPPLPLPAHEHGSQWIDVAGVGAVVSPELRQAFGWRFNRSLDDGDRSLKAQRLRTRQDWAARQLCGRVFVIGKRFNRPAVQAALQAEALAQA